MTGSKPPPPPPPTTTARASAALPEGATVPPPPPSAASNRNTKTTASCHYPPSPGLCLKGRGPPGQFQSGCRAVTEDVQAVGGGGFWRLEMRLGAGVGVWECLWGRVRAVGGGVPPPLSSDSLPIPHPRFSLYPPVSPQFLPSPPSPVPFGHQSFLGKDPIEPLVSGSPTSNTCSYMALASVLIWVPVRWRPFQFWGASVCVRFDFWVRPFASVFPVPCGFVPATKSAQVSLCTVCFVALSQQTCGTLAVYVEGCETAGQGFDSHLPCPLFWRFLWRFWVFWGAFSGAFCGAFSVVCWLRPLASVSVLGCVRLRPF